MDILGTAFGLLGTVIELIKQAEGASKEKHDAIVAALAKAHDDLKAARDQAHASVAADDADMTTALDAAGKPPTAA